VDGALTVFKPGQAPFEIKAPDEVDESADTGGRSARIFRADTAPVLLVATAGAAQVFPAGTFDSVSYQFNGIAVILADGSFAVTAGGMHTIVLRAQAASVFRSSTSGGTTSHSVTPLLYVNDAIREYGTPCSSAMDGVFNPLGTNALTSRWTVRLSAGDVIQTGYRNDRQMDATSDLHRVIGDAGGAGTFLMIVQE
jgi:hypothetical protein